MADAELFIWPRFIMRYRRNYPLAMAMHSSLQVMGEPAKCNRHCARINHANQKAYKEHYYNFLHVYILRPPRFNKIDAATT